jgi:hypothetical protein
VRLADVGLEYLQRALQLRPNYREAIGFMSLLYRQKSFAYLEKPEQWEPLFNAANEWLAKANQAASAAPSTGSPSPASPSPAPASPPPAAPEVAAKPD